MSEDQLLQAVDEAVSFHLIEDVPGQMDRYQFRHALIQQTLYEELSTSRRVRLHARIGDALEELYNGQAEKHAAELAHHYNEAQTLTGPDKPVQYSILAGEQALASFANEDAVDHFQRALAAMEGQSIDGAMADALFGLGKSQLATSQPGGLGVAVGNLILAFDYYANNGDVARAVAVAEFPLPTGAFLLEDARLLVTRALTLVEDDSHDAGRLAARAGLYLGRTRDDYEGAQASFDRALSIARQEGDGDLELLTLANMAEVDLFHLQLEQCLANVQRAIESARRVNNLQAEVQARQRGTLASIITGDAESARLHASEGLDLAEQLRHRWWLNTTIWGNQIVPQLAGDWRAAREFCDRGMAASPNDIRLVANRVLLEHEAGSEEQRDQYLEILLRVRADDSTVLSTQYFMCSFVVPMVLRSTGMTHGLEVARAIADNALSFSSSPPLLTTIARAGLALIAVIEGDVMAAREQYDALQPHRGRLVPNCAGCTVDRLLGLLAQSIGDLDQATSHFEDSLAFCRNAGYRPELAWTCCDYSDTLLQRAGVGDRRNAMTLLDESLAIAEELGMQFLIERVALRRDRVQPGAAPSPTYPDGLSHREVEVLRLVALGKSNSDIAEQLFISPNTVAHHVTNILNKTRTSNRTEAATYAAQHDLL